VPKKGVEIMVAFVYSHFPQLIPGGGGQFFALFYIFICYFPFNFVENVSGARFFAKHPPQPG
jgi:hypothetical protein